jgi:taurine--2-oxoglutarate transaminase
MPYRSPFNTTDPIEETKLALDHLERVILQENPGNIAAIIIEPVLGGDGVVAYPDGYLKGLGAVARKYDILVIHDEVMVGFGRVGEVFATKRFGLEPDIITFAKGVTGAYVPLGGFLLRESLASRYDDRVFDAGHTYSGHPLAMAAGRGALRAYAKGNHFKSAYNIERWLREGLSTLQRELPLIGDVRGLGAFIGVELVRDQTTREPVVAWQGPTHGIMGEFSRALLESGLCIYSKYSLCVLSPPLIITESEVQDGLRIFGDTLRRFASRMLA